MANTELENSIGVVDKRKSATSAELPGNLGATLNYVDVGSLRTTLASNNPTYYTSARLDEMTKNDMVYALRTITDAAGI